MKRKMFDAINLPIPIWARIIELEDFILIKNWYGGCIFCVPRELLPLSENGKETINEILKREEEIFLKIFGY